MLVVDETGAQLEAQVALRDAVPAGTAFVERRLARDGANVLRGATVEIVPIPDPLVIAEPVRLSETGGVEGALA
jgi:hypothetical protein